MTPFRGKVDPFNPSNTLDGLICKKDGPMGGSLYITHGSSNFTIHHLITISEQHPTTRSTTDLRNTKTRISVSRFR